MVLSHCSPTILPFFLVFSIFPLLSSYRTLILASELNTNGTAATGRYWDCCKPSCGWKGKASFATDPVRSCDAAGLPLNGFNAGTGCNGGTAFTCTDQSPWAVNDSFAYGFVGAYIPGGSEGSWCCACYQLTFPGSTALAGKTMLVQASNTDYDVLSETYFTFAIPGGNNSVDGGCARQYNVSADVLGASQTGVETRADCDRLPSPQRAGCQWRFDWLRNVDRPRVLYQRVTCPTALTDITGCVRADDQRFMTSSGGVSSAQGRVSGGLLWWLPGVVSLLALL